VINYRVNHTTHYSYSQPVSSCHNEAHLLPRNLAHQLCLHSQLQIQPLPAVYHEREDFFGNRVTYFAVQESHTTLAVTALSEVQIVPKDIPDWASALAWEEVRTLLRHDLNPNMLEARQFLLDSPFVGTSQVLADYAKSSFSSGRTLLDAAHDLMRRIHKDFTYDPEFTTIATPLSEVFEYRRGVCQDFAHLALGCLRSLGLAARYVSGYVETLPPPG
jgi:transglutaminase-like putative cysteine protease